MDYQTKKIKNPILLDIPDNSQNISNFTIMEKDIDIDPSNYSTLSNFVINTIDYEDHIIYHPIIINKSKLIDNIKYNCDTQQCIDLSTRGFNHGNYEIDLYDGDAIIVIHKYGEGNKFRSIHVQMFAKENEEFGHGHVYSEGDSDQYWTTVNLKHIHIDGNGNEMPEYRVTFFLYQYEYV